MRWIDAYSRSQVLGRPRIVSSDHLHLCAYFSQVIHRFRRRRANDVITSNDARETTVDPDPYHGTSFAFPRIRHVRQLDIVRVPRVLQRELAVADFDAPAVDDSFRALPVDSFKVFYDTLFRSYADCRTGATQDSVRERM